MPVTYVCVFVFLCLCGWSVVYIVCVACGLCVCCPAPLINRLQRVTQADGLPSHPFLSLLCLYALSSDHEGYPSFLFQIGLLDEQEKKYSPEAVQWLLKFIHQEKWLQAFEVSSGPWRCPGAISTIWEGLEASRCLAWCFIVREAVNRCCHRSGGETEGPIRKKRPIWVSLNLL